LHSNLLSTRPTQATINSRVRNCVTPGQHKVCLGNFQFWPLKFSREFLTMKRKSHEFPALPNSLAWLRLSSEVGSPKAAVAFWWVGYQKRKKSVLITRLKGIRVIENFPSSPCWTTFFQTKVYTLIILKIK
jgi:hypothetical protein